MIFSRWRPTGGFDYIEAPGTFPLGDDIKDAVIPASAGGVGTPAQECGRPMSGGRVVGQGQEPRGFIVPTQGAGASGVSGLYDQYAWAGTSTKYYVFTGLLFGVFIGGDLWLSKKSFLRGLL